MILRQPCWWFMPTLGAPREMSHAIMCARRGRTRTRHEPCIHAVSDEGKREPNNCCARQDGRSRSAQDPLIAAVPEAREGQGFSHGRERRTSPHNCAVGTGKQPNNFCARQGGNERAHIFVPCAQTEEPNHFVHGRGGMCLDYPSMYVCVHLVIVDPHPSLSSCT